MEQGSSDLVKYIAEHYGAEHQLPILQEECAELIKAVSKLLRARADHDGSMTGALLTCITEEIGDVELMIDQAVHLTGISRADIEASKRHKVRREMQRIKAAGDR